MIRSEEGEGGYIGYLKLEYNVVKSQSGLHIIKPNL